MRPLSLHIPQGLGLQAAHQVSGRLAVGAPCGTGYWEDAGQLRALRGLDG